MIGQNRNPFPEHLLKEVRTVAFPVKHDGEPVRAWIFREPLLLLQSLRYGPFQPRNHILLERGNQSGVHFLVHVQKWLAVHGIDPVIGRGPQAQPFPGGIVAR